MKKGILLLSLIIVASSSLFIGVHSIPITDVFHLNMQQEFILWQTRVPRTVSLMIAGATASVSGLIMQHLTQNKFVSPTTVGTMDSARLGILVTMLYFPTASILTRSIVAFVFALTGTLLFMLLLQKMSFKNPIMVPLLGMMFGNVIGSFVTFIAYKKQLIQNISTWLEGNFATVTKGDYELIYLSVPLLIVAYLYAYPLTVSGLGEDLAINLGLNYRLVQLIGMTIVALASSVTLVTVGTLPFLGIIIPNIISVYYGDQMKETLGITAVAGSLFLILCDIIARVVIFPYEVSVSLIVSILGSLIFIYLLWKGVNK